MLGYFFLIECIDWPKHRHLPFQSYGYKNCTLQRAQKQTEKSVPQILDSYLYAVKFTDRKENTAYILMVHNSFLNTMYHY